ncbi:MAG: shikimate kinase [bacterium]
MAKNVVLIGLMGCGKSTVAAILSDKLKMKFIDTDSLIVQKEERSINEIFAQSGEAYFREIETQLIKEVSADFDCIISTGGGIVERSGNLEYLKQNGIVFYLKTSVQTLYERLKNQSDRPLLKTENPYETLKGLLEKRENKYFLADITIETDNKNPDKIVGEIIEAYEKQSA